MSKGRTKSAGGSAPYTQADWDAVSETDPFTEDDFRLAKPASEILPEEFFKMLQDQRRALGKPRGRPKLATAKVAVTLRLDPDVLEKFKADGDDWRQNMSAILRKAAGL